MGRASAAGQRLQLGMALVVALVLLLLTACGPARHDLEVVNAWDRGVAVYVVAERAGLPDQAAPLGPVRVGATERSPPPRLMARSGSAFSTATTVASTKSTPTCA